jgi:hypothetical protein
MDEETLNKAKIKEYCEKYPFLRWYGDPLYMGYSEDGEPADDYTWEDEMPEGWRKAFCPRIWDELKAILEKADYVDKFRFAQIKEKWGELRMYHCGAPEQIYDEVEDLLEGYLKRSVDVCIDCGAPATRMMLGWIKYVCDDCAKTKELGWHIPKSDIDAFYEDRDAYIETHKAELDANCRQYGD